MTAVVFRTEIKETRCKGFLKYDAVFEIRAVWTGMQIKLQTCLPGSLVSTVGPPYTLIDKGKAILVQTWTGSEGSGFHDSRHTKVVKLSARRAVRLYAPGNTPGTHFS